MGAWGSGPFDNDDAADFAGDLSEVNDSDQVLAQLESVLVTVTAGEGYLESPDVSIAIAAAVIVAMFDNPSLPTSSYLDSTWLASVRTPTSEEIRTLALGALTRAFQPEDNEWFDLWDEGGLVEEVRANLEPYTVALRSAST